VIPLSAPIDQSSANSMDILPFQRGATHARNESSNQAPECSLDILPLPGAWQPQQIIAGPVLGNGRAAKATLVEAIRANGESILAVEKMFRPSLLTRFIYRCSFQAPFAYQFTRDAISACYYRRRVAAAILEATTPGVRVAMPLYVRHDRENDAWVLGSEFIRGRGVRPAPANSSMLRSWLGRRLLRRPADSRRREEIAELVQTMRSLEWVFRRSGLVGAAWQVCPSALVSTANVLKADDSYVIIDLESGIPAVAVGKYLFDSLRLAAPPLFDDVDVKRLSRWLDSRRLELTGHLGQHGFDSLCEDAHRLVHHTRRWKGSELALLRNRTSIISRGFRRRHRRRLIETWQRSGVIDATAAALMRDGANGLRRMTYLLGLAPGRLGRFLQRCVAHDAYRTRVRWFLRDRDYRRSALHQAATRRWKRWANEGRLSPSFACERFGPLFLLHFVLSMFTPAGMHRWLTDRQARREALTAFRLLCVSPRYQSAFGRHVVGEAVRRWQRQGRLEPAEAEQLHRQMSSNEIDEYARCFAMHLGLKVVMPVLMPLKFGGLAATLATGNFLYLLPVFVLPAARTTITLSRMLHPSRRHIRYAEALLIGPIPVLGSLAYPVQIRASHPELSAFLLREAAARFGRSLPIYGGQDSRVEIWAIKFVNLILEAIDVLLAITSPFGRLFSRKAKSAQPVEEPSTLRFPRLAHMEQQFIARLQATESEAVSEAELAWREWRTRTSQRRVA
jgi:hypothetical protein